MNNNRIVILTIIILIAASCERSKKVDLGGKYQLVSSASFNDLTVVTSGNIVIVKGHVLDYAFDSSMIILSQRPRDSVQGIGKLTYKEYKKVFNESDFKQYWIIDKRLPQNYNKENYTFSNAYGPFKEQVFLEKREQLGVSKELTLKH